MTIYTTSAPLPKHLYVWIEPNAIGEHGWIQATWFGLVTRHGRTFGCNVLLECGAIYREVPLHKLAWRPDAITWTPREAQNWDCYGAQMSLLEYPYLTGVDAKARCAEAEYEGGYLFTIVPYGDAWSAVPSQAKEFMVIKLDNGRFTAQPTNRLLFTERSFTTKIEWPTWLKPLDETWSSE